MISTLPAPVSDTTRREFLALFGAAGLLAGCGAPRASGPAEPATRTVTDLAGRSVDIPADPQRVVALDPNRVVTDLVVLGIVPVGATTNATNPGGGFAETLGSESDGIEAVGVVGEADLERVAALRPDLIFYASDYQDIPIDRLATIAPTISYPRPPDGLLEPVRWLGGLLDREGRATELERELHHAVAARREQIGLAGRRVAVVNLRNYESVPVVTVAAAGTYVAEFAELLGATIVPGAIDGTPLSNGEFVEVSLELVAYTLADAEYVLALRYGGSTDADRTFDELTANPVWRAVPAVAAREVAYLDVQRAGGNIGIDGIRLALDDLAAQHSGGPS